MYSLLNIRTSTSGNLRVYMQIRSYISMSTYMRTYRCICVSKVKYSSQPKRLNPKPETLTLNRKSSRWAKSCSAQCLMHLEGL